MPDVDSLRQDKDKDSPGTNPLSANNAVAPNAQPSKSGGQQSWGDKYKAKTLDFSRGILVNYIINFAISAAFTYKFKKSAWGQKLDKRILDFATKDGKVSPLKQQVGEYFTATQLLLFGGHAVLPFMKYFHDHKLALEFGIGHQLDRLQEFTGNGNAATTRRLEEYKVVTDILKARPTELSDKNKALLAKNGIGDNLLFNEHHSKWSHVLKARLGGVINTTALGFGLAIASSSGKKFLDFNKFAEEKAGPYIGDKFVKPVLGTHVEKPTLLGKYVLIELIYTLASKLGFDRIERRQRIKQHQEEMEAAARALGRDEQALNQMGSDYAGGQHAVRLSSPVSRTSALDARRKILDDGEKDFRARELSKPAAANALS